MKRSLFAALALALLALAACGEDGPPPIDYAGMTPDDALMKAAYENDAEAFGAAVERGADLDAVDEISGIGLTDNLFIKASASGYGLPSLDLVKAATDAGWSPTSTIKNGETPLFIAVGSGNYEMASYLMENGADINRRLDGVKSVTPLQWVFWDGGRPVDHEKLDWLIQNGADPNGEPQHNYDYPLYMAVQRKDIEGVKRLLDAGADPALESRGLFGRDIYVPLAEHVATGEYSDEMKALFANR